MPVVAGGVFLQGELFPHEERAVEQHEPLAARMRPRNLDELVGQQHLVGEGTVLRQAMLTDNVPSIIFWGPPGTGKTTLTRIIGQMTDASFRPISAVAAGVSDLRRIVDEAGKLRRATGRKTVVFIDELHRFNKAQQDVILPYIEDGVITLIGTTTENPSFEINAALLSRCRVFTLRPLTEDEIRSVIKRAVADGERGLAKRNVKLSEDALAALATLSDGDARVALNALELAADGVAPKTDGSKEIDVAAISDAMQRRTLLYDKGGDQHYDLISALHKSVRDSDPDASIYWLARMLESGEDPLYVARRLIRMATEDVGLADPQALPIAVAAQQAIHFLGMPEGNLALVEAAVYMALAPKSNALYRAYDLVQKDLRSARNEAVPLPIRNAPTRLMKELGYGDGYKYAHDSLPKDGMRSKLNENLPPSLNARRYYEPTARGYEQELSRRIKEWSGE